jgi:hypothetical protein
MTFAHRETTFYKMVSSLIVEYKLGGATNFRSWKTKILFILDENEIQNYVKEDVSEPTSAKDKVGHKKNEQKSKRILIDSIKYHLIPHIVEMNTSKGMLDSLVGLFESNNTRKKLVLRNHL